MGLQVGGGTQSGASNQNSSGATSGTNASQITPNPTQNWGDVSAGLKANLGGQGMTPEQQAAAGYFGSQLGQGNYAAGGMDNAASQIAQHFANYQAPQAAATSNVNAPSAASQMGQYANPYTQQVINASNQDLLHGGQVAANDLLAKYGGSGAFGGGGQQVAMGELGSGLARAMGTQDATLRQQGFNTALGAGQSDASNLLQASGQTAANTLNQNEFNAQQQAQGQNQWLQAAQQYVGALGQGADTRNQAAAGALGAGGTGVNQFLSYLNAQTPAFGQSQTGTTTGTFTGTQTGHNSGSSAQAGFGGK